MPYMLIESQGQLEIREISNLGDAKKQARAEGFSYICGSSSKEDVERVRDRQQKMRGEG